MYLMVTAVESDGKTREKLGVASWFDLPFFDPVTNSSGVEGVKLLGEAKAEVDDLLPTKSTPQKRLVQ